MTKDEKLDLYLEYIDQIDEEFIKDRINKQDRKLSKYCDELEEYMGDHCCLYQAMTYMRDRLKNDSVHDLDIEDDYTQTDEYIMNTHNLLQEAINEYVRSLITMASKKIQELSDDYCD